MILKKMMKTLRKIVPSKHAHLCLGLLALYGISFLITQTSKFEKIKDSLKWYCYADYEVRNSLFSREILEAEFYREKYKERLNSLTDGLFDYTDKHQIQKYFMAKGLLYDVWQGKGNNSYIVAEIVDRGTHDTETPEKINFNYIILGNKKILPFLEYKEGYEARGFVSAGETAIYIHRDSLDYLLRWYFESLWQSDTSSSKGFYKERRGCKDQLTYSLYRDLKDVCEDVFVKRLYRNKRKARKYFVEEGFKVFLPTFLAMGGRMAADKNSSFSPGHKYQRALLTGFALKPNYTMFFLTYENREYNPLVLKLWGELGKRIGMSNAEEITLTQISKVSQEVLEELGKFKDYRRKEG